MALGAAYAGVRSLVTTSGGGYALMTEGVSLAGMTEIPVVIHLAQRPGPATGLPTRTEQADLEFVLYGGHGEFPRIVYAPGDLEEAVQLTQRAFNQADKFQVPAFILTDQYFMDSYYNASPFDLKSEKNENFITKTAKDYKRYTLTKDGISPRGIPGYGNALIGVDSDEHDEEGHITEDLALRTRMVDKRLKKLALIKKEALPPTLIGPKDYRVLVIGWGSTLNTIKEALALLGRKDVGFLHFSQVYPLHEKTGEYLKKAEMKIIVENNATSQLGNLIRRHTDIRIEHQILKYSGLAFSVEELVERLGDIISEGEAV
jgi:2-oxoglutarate ferredoxin oxidoreductase subunit alpha